MSVKKNYRVKLQDNLKLIVKIKNNILKNNKIKHPKLTELI